ncbi:MAG: nicotinamide-nucleotide adenylyltransferase [Candidatus Bilamarchaeum sp.]|jgi:nicotinamide-nucleotide adenylyltransferase
MKKRMLIGRFQPFHNGHLIAIKSLLKKSGEVVLVVGSSEDFMSPENPFTAGERLEMIRSSFSKSDLARLIVVPVRDVNDNSIWVDHVLSQVPAIDEVYSNNQLVKMLFSRHGVMVHSTPLKDRENLEGTNVRILLAKADKSWKKLVPPAVAKYLDQIGAEKRLSKIIRV